MQSLAVRLFGKVASSPEANVLLFAFLLFFPWEMIQAPFFQGISEMSHWEAVLHCTRHTIGDALISLCSFWAVALLWQDRGWIANPVRQQVWAFVGVGVVATVAFEWHATEIADRWAYAPIMPVLPFIGTGLVPLLAWFALPLVLVWLVHRQLRGTPHSSETNN